MPSKADDKPTAGDMPPVDLRTPVQYLKGVGPRRAERFARLGIETVADLVRHLPHRWEHHVGETPIRQLPVGSIATARGMVATCRFVPARGSAIGRARGGNKGRFQATLEDDSGTLDLVWFNGGYLRNKLKPGMMIAVTARVDTYNNYPQMVNPKWESLSDDDSDEGGEDERLRPVYPATEDLPGTQIEKVIEGVLEPALEQIEDHFDPAYREKRALVELREAYRMMHAPAHRDEVKQARRRLAYDELLLLQLGVAVKRRHNETALQAPTLRFSDAIDRHIRDRFPFSLTPHQEQVVRELAADLQRPIPMNRLLQGDVGSGKTVVALYALLMAVASGKQGAIMAPTELLAEQHHISISNMLEGSTVRIALLTGSMPAANRRELAERIAAGEVDIVIGTHALLTEAVRFHDLAVVVVDEQHRFGVMQRAVFRSKAEDRAERPGEDKPIVPHNLVMTATPIPRTLSLTVFGDLDVSIIAGLPPGRQPIATRVVGEQKRTHVYDYLVQRLARGEQAYIVVPAIDQDETNLRSVRSQAKTLQDGALKNFRVAAVHGRLKADMREKIMRRFRAGEIDALVATTVIEVGVDVPNATMMIVEHAERFGLAQLHQLRGRVGRGSVKSVCVFIADPTTDDGRQRMAAIAETTDGFEIAEADLRIRGMGELLGARQAGAPTLQLASIPEDMDLLRLAKRDAMAIARDDPRLAADEHRLLRARLIKHYGEMISIADVG